MKRLIVAVVLFVASSVASAFTPSPGLWYNPSESGRGFNIEIQNNVMAVASYVYDQQGNPIWYTSSGIFDEGTESFTGSFDGAAGGQCLGCSYVPPVLTSGEGGLMQIVFTSAETARLYFQGGSTPIQHFNFGYNGKNGYFLGEWAFSINVQGAVSAQWINFTGYYTGTDGTVYVQGTGDGVPSTTALGVYEATSDTFIVVVIDGGTGGTFTYNFKGDNSRMFGAGSVGPTAAPPSYPAIGSRILTPSELGVTASAGMIVNAKSIQVAPSIAVLQHLEQAIQAHIRSNQ